MPSDFFAKINDLPRNGELDDWQRWHDELVASGNELLEMVDALLASSTDEAMERRLEVHRARVISIMSFAQRVLSKGETGRTTAPAGRNLVH